MLCKEKLGVDNRVRKNGTEKRIGIATGRSAEQMNERLRTREGEKDIYKIANLRKRQRQVSGQLSVIKDKDGNILRKDKDLKKRW